MKTMVDRGHGIRIWRKGFALFDCTKRVLINLHHNCRVTPAGGRGIPRKRALRVPSHVRPDHQARNRRIILHRQQEMQRGGVRGG